MVTAITNGIKISVQSEYMTHESQPMKGNYMFSYSILIENHGSESVQLKRRHWFILDSYCLAREAEGEGVIGQQPVIHPGEKFSYTSWVPLTSEIGRMYGYYEMSVASSDEHIRIAIPEFLLVAHTILN